MLRLLSCRSVWRPGVSTLTRFAHKKPRTKVDNDSEVDDAPADLFSVAIVGRPNVGKSTLFNRLCGRAEALVHNTPGVTRDRRSEKASFAGFNFVVTDTAGLDDTPEEERVGPYHWKPKQKDSETLLSSVLVSALEQTTLAIRESSITVFMLDGKVGVTPQDRHFVRWLHKQGKPAILVVNKSEGNSDPLEPFEVAQLGLGEPIYISAQHKLGMVDLCVQLEPLAIGAARLNKGADVASALEGPRVLVVGRPNAGKSSLVNQMIGDPKRLLVGPEPGVTRDSILVPLRYKDRQFRLIDTAGVRKRGKIYKKSDSLEIMSSSQALHQIERAHVVILCVNGEEDGVIQKQFLTNNQDLSLARLVNKSGKCLMLVVNKIDLIPKAQRKKVVASLTETLGSILQSDVGKLRVVCVSALTGESVDQVKESILDLYDRWKTKPSTKRLNNWLVDMRRARPDMTKSFRFIISEKSGPPTFTIFQRGEPPKPNLQTWVKGSLRQRFNLEGVNVEVMCRCALANALPAAVSLGAVPTSRSTAPILTSPDSLQSNNVRM